MLNVVDDSSIMCEQAKLVATPETPLPFSRSDYISVRVEVYCGGVAPEEKAVVSQGFGTALAVNKKGSWINRGSGVLLIRKDNSIIGNFEYLAGIKGKSPDA